LYSLNANKDNTTDAPLIRKGSSLQKFEMAENICSAPLPDPLWDHYYPKALSGGLSKYSLNSGFLLSSKVCSPD
jgi:hypothetical protein